MPPGKQTWRHRPMATVKTKDGADLYCEVQGDGEPLLLVTGLGGNASFWTEQVPYFAQRFRVITYDHRGAGRSSMSRIAYSVDQMAEDALSVMDGLGIDKAHLVGHSTGGAIGQVIAIEQPHRLLSLVASSSWTTADAYFKRLFEVRKEALAHGASAYVRCGTLFQFSPEHIAENIEAIRAGEQAIINAFPPVEIVASKIDAVVRFDRTRDLHRIRVPTFVNTAVDDLICPPYFSRALVESIPGARLGIVAKGGHFCPRSAASLYFRNVDAFLRDLKQPLN